MLGAMGNVVCGGETELVRQEVALARVARALA